jgi:phosphonate metabolism protein PhnN/1,5-bisphosphokinase (PRPP-forming)
VSGVLVLVVGASGVGKDSLIAGGRAALAEDARVVFPRRTITRPADAGGEAHEAVTPEEFEHRRAAGAFALDWRAHGIAYGIDRGIAEPLAAGRHVVINVSRTVTAAAAERFARTLVVRVTAAPETLARRLAERGRESTAEIAARLARAEAIPVDPAGAVELANDGPLAEGVARLVSLLRGLDGA